MMDVKALIDAATLKGYLIASDAPREISAIAEQLVEGLSNQIERVTGERITNDAVAIPLPTDRSAWFADAEEERTPKKFEYPLETAETTLPSSTGSAPDSDSVDEPRSIPPVTQPSQSLREEQKKTLRGRNLENVWEDWQLEKLKELKAAGAVGSVIASAINKTPTQINNKWTWLKDRLPKDNHLDKDGWPLPAKPVRKEPFTGTNATEAPKMQFVKVRVRDSWGHEREIERPAPIGAEQDPDSGATVTKYPAGYARGAHPQRNVHVKGGS